MEKISEKIMKMCPRGIERVRLGDVCEALSKGALDMRNLPDNGKYPVYNSGKDITGYYNEYNNNCEAITIASRGEYAGCISYANGMFWAGVLCYPYKIKKKTNVNLRYLYYSLKGQESDIMIRLVSRGGIPAINKKDIENYVIPLPPLPIQLEIVRILDTFTQLQSNLEAELAARQKQYEYYRNKLLTFDENDESVEWKTLGEVGSILRGNGLQKSDFSEEGVGCIHYGQIYTRLGFSCDKTLTYVPEQLAKSLTKVEPGNLVIACTSENVEDVCKSVVWLGNEVIVTGGHACVFKHNENPKYIGYCFITNDFFNQKKKYAYGAKVIDIKTEKLAQIIIPVPSRELQDEIVSKLDCFESLIANIKQEIEARKKQYEYYREQLLTFE